MMLGKSSLIIASNRLPVKLSGSGRKRRVESGAGGLVTALVPVLRNRGGQWVGWPGVVEENGISDLDPLLSGLSKDLGYDIRPVHLTEQERRDFYFGFSNEIVWPMFHDLQTLCHFAPEYWTAYGHVNRKFAEVIGRYASSDDYVWVHDYHLMGVRTNLKEFGVSTAAGFFLHTPFPPLDIFLKIPWRLGLLRMLLDFDLIGFQTERDRRNFLQCLQTLVSGTTVEGAGHVVDVHAGERRVRVGAFPISIDFAEFDSHAATPAVGRRAEEIRDCTPGRTLILGVDRLDYTKGIPYRLDAFRSALRRHPELRERISLIQIVVPSRTEVPRYQELKTEIEQLVGRINGEFSQTGWIPVHYIFRSLNRGELLAYYRAADIALVTPLKDGMNLIAKEYCAAQIEENGTLILSEFAGAASQLQEGALLVNPYHIEEVADAIQRAFQLPADEKSARMRSLRATIRDQDIFWWVDSFLKAAFHRSLNDFPVLEEYLPRLEFQEEGEA
jgi:trehalose 6-phosphate synthase/phosphatase